MRRHFVWMQHFMEMLQGLLIIDVLMQIWWRFLFEVETPDRHYYHVVFFINRKVEPYEEMTWVLQRATQDQIAYFGQTPSQLLTTPHLKKRSLADALHLQMSIIVIQWTISSLYCYTLR